MNYELRKRRLNQSAKGIDPSLCAQSTHSETGQKLLPVMNFVLVKDFFSPFHPLQKHVRKVVGGFGKKSCVSTGVRSQETHVRHRPP